MEEDQKNTENKEQNELGQNISNPSKPINSEDPFSLPIELRPKTLLGHDVTAPYKFGQDYK